MKRSLSKDFIEEAVDDYLRLIEEYTEIIDNLKTKMEKASPKKKILYEKLLAEVKKEQKNCRKQLRQYV